MKLYLTKFVDWLFAAMGLVLGIAMAENVFDLYYDEPMTVILPVALSIVTVLLKTAICSFAMQALAKSISERLKKEAE